jgi:transposase
MDRVVVSVPQAQTDTLFCALELSKKTWLLGIQFPDREQPSVYPIKGGDSEGLLAKLGMATDRYAKPSGKKPSIRICYEARYDAFWLARFLKAHGIECLVIDSASMQVNRRSRRAYRPRQAVTRAHRLVPRRAACVVGGSRPKHR